MWLIFFLAIPLLGFAYVGWHIWLLLPVAWGWKLLVLTLFFAALALLTLDIGGYLDRLPLGIAQVCYEIGTSSIIVLLYAVLLFLLVDTGRLLHLVPRGWVVNNLYGALGIFAVLFAVMLYGNLHYRHKVRVPLSLHTEKTLPKPYKIVLLSDLHLGYHNDRSEFERWVEMINAEKPDYILVAGDIIDISVRPLLEEDVAAAFRRLHAPVYACLGNHEYYSGAPNAQAFYEAAQIRLLRDEAVVHDSALVVVGRDDRTNPRRLPLNRLLEDVPRDKFLILLDHQPYNLEESERAGVDFQFSGHTHRGQVWPLSWVTDKIYECSWGEHRRGGTHYYVSSGLGIWGGKFRIGTQSEYVVLTLQ